MRALVLLLPPQAENLGTHQQVLCDAYDKEHPESFAAAQEETEWK